MFWTEFKIIKLSLVLISILVLASCSDEEVAIENESKKSSSNKTEALSERERIIRQVENVLEINALENYDIQIKYEYIDQDTLRDALILVNRKEYAYKKAKNTNTERFFEETGNTGLYNYVFLLMGGKDKIISTNPVGSNANYPLKVEFLDLTSKAHTDFFVEFRVRNSLYRNYYTVRNNRLFLTFNCPVFDNVGDEKPVVYDIQHEVSSVRIAKDIALYKGEFVDYNPSEIENVNEYEPSGITNNGELYVYFIFNEKSMKYVTPMRSPEK